MSRFIAPIALVLLLTACGDDPNTEPGRAVEGPPVNDSPSIHPNGMSNSSVISTDTSAMRVDDSATRK